MLPARVRPSGVLGAEYGRFWLAQTVNFVGGEVSIFALPLVAAVTLHAGPTAMGGLVAVQQLPNALAGPLLGPLVDRLPLRRMMLTLDVVRAALVGAIPLLYAVGALSLPLLIGIAFVLGVLAVLYDLGYVAFVPRLVPDERLLAANGRLEGSYTAAQVAGPGLGGLLVGLVGASTAMLADAASYLGSALLLGTVRVDGRPERAEGPPVEQRLRRYLAEIGSGLRLLWREPGLRLLGLGAGVFNLFSGAAAAVLVLYVIRELHVAPSWFGLALALGAAGGVLGALVTERLGIRFGPSLVMPAGLLFIAAGELVLVGLPPGWEPGAVAGVAASQLLGAFGLTVYVVTGMTIRQRLIPRAVLATVYGSMRLLSRGALPIGALVGGALVPALGLRAVLLAAAVGELATAAVFSRFRHQLDPADAAPEPV